MDSHLRKALVANYDKGNGYRRVSKKYGIPKSTIRAKIKKYHRTNATETLERGGRQKKITGTAGRRIVRAAKKNPTNSQKLNERFRSIRHNSAQNNYIKAPEH
ncbi:UNVERIFIED_CONTAM: hypothetical protein FKN15_065758 [Acipenser sinensis]